MIGVSVTVPVACFRKGMAREYLETEPIPPPMPASPAPFAMLSLMSTRWPATVATRSLHLSTIRSPMPSPNCCSGSTGS